MKKSICVFCVEEEKIRLTVLFRSAADKCSAPFSPISLNSRLECVECLCEKVDLCVLCRRRENSTHCVVS